MPRNTNRADADDLRQQCEDLLNGIVKAIPGTESDPNRPRLYFPNGIDVIDIQIDIKNGKLGLRLSGPPSQPSESVESLLRQFAPTALVGALTDGIDVSRFQGDVNWAKVAAAGKSYSYIKATEGATLVDEKFEQNWSGSKDAGVIRGAYHFFLPTRSVKDQVDNFVGAVETLDDTDMPPVMDLEVRNGWDKIAMSKRPELVLQWLQSVQAALDCRPMVYTSKSFMDEIMGASKALSGYPLWVVDYSSSGPRLPAGWDNWTFWQFSESGSCSGVNGKVDLDHFSGDLTELKNFIAHQHGSSDDIDLDTEKTSANRGER